MISEQSSILVDDFFCYPIVKIHWFHVTDHYLADIKMHGTSEIKIPHYTNGFLLYPKILMKKKNSTAKEYYKTFSWCWWIWLNRWNTNVNIIHIPWVAVDIVKCLMIFNKFTNEIPFGKSSTSINNSSFSIARKWNYIISICISYIIWYSS